MKPTIFAARFLLPIAAPPIEDGALLVADKHIQSVGSRKELVSHSPSARVVDFEDAVLLPPMVNAHTHLELSHFSTWAHAAGEPDAPQSFVDWILWLVRVRQSINENQLRESLQDGLRASLAAGTGAIGDIFTSLDVVELYHDSPVAGKVYAEVLGHNLKNVSKRLETIAAHLDEPPGSLLKWGLSPHTPYTLSASAMSRVFGFASDNKLQKCIHLGESQEEKLFHKEGGGQIAEKLYAAAQWDPGNDRIQGDSPVKALWQNGRLNNGDLVVHGVQVDDEDISFLKDSGCVVVLCPRSNAALEVGTAPLEKYLQAGVSLALGTDSLASAPSLSVWDELAFAQSWFSGNADHGTWLDIATRGGANALGVDYFLGELSRGKGASFQVVQLPEMPNHKDLEATLCNVGDGVHVSHLYLGGENVLP